MKEPTTLNIKSTMIMASILITAWQIEGGKVEVVTDFLSLGSTITCLIHVNIWQKPPQYCK